MMRARSVRYLFLAVLPLLTACDFRPPKYQSSRPGEASAATRRPTLAPAATSAAQSNTPQSASAWRPCNAIAALETGVGDPAPLPAGYCNATAPSGDACPAAERILVVVDHDNETASSGMWHSLIQMIDAAGAECPDGLSVPIHGRLPGQCATIQGLAASGAAVGACRRGASVFPAGVAAGGDRTPAAGAVRSLCQRLSGNTTDIALLAFDGVADANPHATTPSQELAEAVAACAAKKLVISAVVSPETYRYVYVFSDREHRDYAQNLTAKLARQWSTARIPAEALFLTPRWETRAPVAEVAFAAGSNQPELPWDTEGPDVMRVMSGESTVGYRVDARRWTSSTESKGKAFRLTWNADPSRWSTTASAGLLARPPLVYGNRRAPEDPAVSLAPGAPYQYLSNCNATQEAGAYSGRTGCNQSPPARNFYQSIDVAAGSAELALFTGDQLDWLGADKKVRAYAAKVRSSRGAAATSLALVVPKPEVDPCLQSLSSAIRTVHLWPASQTTAAVLSSVDVTSSCEGSPLRALEPLFARTRPKYFAMRSGTFAATADRRVGMESLVSAMAEVARVERNKAAAAQCVLCTVRVTFDSCKPPKTIALSQ